MKSFIIKNKKVCTKNSKNFSSKIIIFSLLILTTLFVSCSSEQPETQVENFDCGLFKEGQNWEDNNNFCTCTSGEINCVKTEVPKEVEEEIIKKSERMINLNLTDLEEKYLNYLQDKNQYSRIIFLNTEEFNCENCYKINYKKDREIIQVEIVNSEKTSEKLISGNFEDLLIDRFSCDLFEGNFVNNACLITKDETEYRQRSERCGYPYYGDCTSGYSCVISAKDSIYGTCQKR